MIGFIELFFTLLFIAFGFGIGFVVLSQKRRANVDSLEDVRRLLEDTRAELAAMREEQADLTLMLDELNHALPSERAPRLSADAKDDR